MIITNPTGLYDPVLPVGKEPGNITFTISNNSPPKSSETFIQLPISEELRSAPNRIFNRFEKRKFLGELIFDVIEPGPSVEGSGDNQYELGEILEFSDDDIEEVDTYELEKIILRQDTKVVDFERAGLSSDDYDRLKNASEIKINSITSQINDIGSKLKSNSSEIDNIQSSINNANSILNNILVVFGDSDPSAIKVKMKLNELNENKLNFINIRSSLQSELNNLRDELQKIRESVR